MVLSRVAESELLTGRLPLGGLLKKLVVVGVDQIERKLDGVLGDLISRLES